MSIFSRKKIFTFKGGSGGSSISGLTTGYLTKATGASTIGDSVVYESSGNVGINTITPTSKLHIVGQDSTSGTYALKLENQSSDPLFYSRNDGLHSMGTTIANGVRLTIKAIGDVSSGNEVLRLDNDVNGRIAVFRNDGYVGLGGITIPTAILHAKGSDATSSNYAAKFDNNANSPLFYVRNDGVILANNLPTSSAGLPSGAIWNNSGILNIV